MTNEKLFASFVLDHKEDLEIALHAEDVIEATAIANRIQPLPASLEFIEGVMQLRDQVVPIINLKKRLDLEESIYDEDAKIAIVSHHKQQYGLLFEDIKEVLRVDLASITPIHPSLQADDHIISGLINIENDKRTLEMLDLDYLFPEGSPLEDESEGHDGEKEIIPKTYSQYVVFSAGNQEYGVPVNFSQEITFITAIDEMYKNKDLEGALQLRGRTVPVLNAGTMLNGYEVNKSNEQCRILIIVTDELFFGIVVEKMSEIIRISDDEILPMPSKNDPNVFGIYQPSPDRNIMMIDIENIVSPYAKTVKSLCQIKSTDSVEHTEALTSSRHLITENCYLVFSIDKNFAIELKDVQEIIERDAVMKIPEAEGYLTEVINLRNRVIPVINLRKFYDYPDRGRQMEPSRFIICGDASQVVALEVDAIVTIYKQEQYFSSPSLNPQLQPKQDTLDKLMEFIDDQGQKEHVLIINTHNLINNHIHCEPVFVEQEEGEFARN